MERTATESEEEIFVLAFIYDSVNSIWCDYFVLKLLKGGWHQMRRFKQME